MLFKEGKANWMRNFTFAIIIIIAQGVGALIGCVFAAGGYSWEKDENVKNNAGTDSYVVAQLCPSNGCDDGGDLIPKVLIAEAVCTFLFVSMVLMVVKHNGSTQAPVNALVIGLALYAAIRMSSGISGGCINPAVGLFQSLFQKMASQKKFPNSKPVAITYVPCYVGGPFLGGFVAALWHKWIHERALNTALELKNEEGGEELLDN